jgi:polysaccharide biosynthesis transport protein
MSSFAEKNPARPLTDAQAEVATVLSSDERRRQNELPAILKYWRVARRWYRVILSILVVSMVIGAVVTLLMTPKYTATATIEIARQQDKIVQVQDVRQESNSLDLEFYQTQYALLTSRSLAERVVADLKLTDDNEFFRVMGIKLKSEGFFADSGSKRLNAEQRSERSRKAAEALLDHIRINPLRGSRLVDVSFTSPDPALSMKIANAWTGHFIESNLARRFDATAYARSFLETRLEQLRQRLELSERQLVAYAAGQRIISIPSSNAAGDRSDRPIVAENLATLNTALGEAIADRIKAQSRAGGQSDGATSEALQNTAIASLRQKRAEVAAEYARLLAQFEPGYPQAEATARQLAELDRSIAREVGRVRQGAQTSYSEALLRENVLQERVEQLKGDLLDLKRRSIQYNIYQRDVDTNRQLYDGLLQRYKEIGIAGGVGTNNIAIVDVAKMPEKPSSPRLALNLALAFIVGLIAAGAATFGLEQVDEAVKDPSELERTTNQPILGVIPKAVDGLPLELLRDRKSAQAEAYLSMQTSLQFSTDHGVPKTLAVTSTRPSEAKSITSFALALTLSRTGRRVVLIDCDMRSPSVHHLLGLGNERGVSNFLAGDDRLEQMLLPDASDGFSVLAAGPTPPSAAELLTGLRLPLLFERLLEKYDHVIVDCPPVLGLADAPLIASRVEGVIYVVRSEGPRARLVRQAIERLQAANANLLGVVLTVFEAGRAHYGYGYDYGYGYGRQSESADRT